MNLYTFCFMVSAALFAVSALTFRSKYYRAEDLRKVAEATRNKEKQVLLEVIDELDTVRKQLASVSTAGYQAHVDATKAQLALRELHNAYFDQDGDMRLRLIRRHEAMKSARKVLGLPETAQVIDIRSSLKN